MEKSGYKVMSPSVIELWGVHKGVKLYAITDDINLATDPIEREKKLISHNAWKIKSMEDIS